MSFKFPTPDEFLIEQAQIKKDPTQEGLNHVMQYMALTIATPQGGIYLSSQEANIDETLAIINDRGWDANELVDESRGRFPSGNKLVHFFIEPKKTWKYPEEAMKSNAAWSGYRFFTPTEALKWQTQRTLDQVMKKLPEKTISTHNYHLGTDFSNEVIKNVVETLQAKGWEVAVDKSEDISDGCYFVRYTVTDPREKISVAASTDISAGKK